LTTCESAAADVCQYVLDQKDINLIIVLTESGNLAKLVSKYRPEVKILACSTHSHAIRQTNFMRGVVGLQIPTLDVTHDDIK
jgi:pyruvate kinase